MAPIVVHAAPALVVLKVLSGPDQKSRVEATTCWGFCASTEIPPNPPVEPVLSAAAYAAGVTLVQPRVAVFNFQICPEVIPLGPYPPLL
jgi:hypothetical protein